MTRSVAQAERIRRDTDENASRRALLAGCIGNLVEWYDFALYGAFATIIATTFFAGSDPLTGLLAAFGVFGVAFLARPVGALLFGHFGDRFGRRRALAVGILMMAVVTAAIGMLPTYAAVGRLAPVLLVLLRAAQGVAVGGEYGGSAALVVEYAPDDRRGWYGGWQWATVGFGLTAGIAMAALVSASLPESAVRSWGWRLPFLLALPLGVVGLYIRARLEETPAFRAALQLDELSGEPLLDALRSTRRQMVIGFGIAAAVAVTFNVFYVFLPNYLAAQDLVPLSEALGTALLGLAIGSAVAPVFGRISDRVGRRPILLGGLLLLVVLIIPASSLIQRADVVGMLAGYLLIGVPLGALALSAFLAELFPTRVRYSGLSVTYGVATALFGGTAPLVANLLARQTGTLLAPMSYATIATAVAVLCVLAASETAHRPLDAER